MDPATAVIFAVLVALGIVLGPICGAESRPDFLRPDVKHHRFAGSMRPSHWRRDYR